MTVVRCRRGRRNTNCVFRRAVRQTSGAARFSPNSDRLSGGVRGEGVGTTVCSPCSLGRPGERVSTATSFRWLKPRSPLLPAEAVHGDAPVRTLADLSLPLGTRGERTAACCSAVDRGRKPAVQTRSGWCFIVIVTQNGQCGLVFSRPLLAHTLPRAGNGEGQRTTDGKKQGRQERQRQEQQQGMRVTQGVGKGGWWCRFRSWEKTRRQRDGGDDGVDGGLR